MKEFYQTPEFLNAVAGVIVILIAIAFLVGAHPFRAKKRLVVTGKMEDPALLTAGDYFTFLSSIVRSSPTLEKLSETMPLIEGYFDKKYRVPISNSQLKEYYARLLEVYCTREAELEYIPVELCKN